MISLDLEKLVCVMKARLDSIGILTMRGREGERDCKASRCMSTIREREDQEGKERRKRWLY